MKRFGSIAVLAGVLALNTGKLHAESTVANTAAERFSFITARNVFGLNPPSSSQAQQNSTPPTSPPKITLTGITTILGPAEALYNVAGGIRSGKQWQDESYILKEGQEKDEVAVMAIDAEKAVVTFNNHGVRQDIALTNESFVAEKLFAAAGVTSPSDSKNPKPGDYKPKPGDDNYADQKSVTAPLPPGENLTSAIEAQSMIYSGGIGSDTPPGHGGF